MKWESSAARAERFAGCLLGLAVGDALGAPYEGLTHADIFFQFGSPDSLVKNPSGDTLFYTDDTEMMIGVAETLAECGRVEEDRLCQAFAENYHPERGYGQARGA
jgi:poly(ADP-ribose) glycohydrolase ARH3